MDNEVKTVEKEWSELPTTTSEDAEFNQDLKD